MTHIEASRLLARQAMEHINSLPIEQHVPTLQAVALTLDGDESKKAETLLETARTLLTDIEKFRAAQMQFTALLHQGEGH